jgi:hypothetical protein
MVGGRFARGVDFITFTCGRGRVPGQRAAMVATF